MSGPPLTVLLHGDPQAPQQARLGAALARRGHRVIVADAPLVAAAIQKEHGARCEELRVARPWLPRAAERWLARRAARALGVDVVHLNYLHPRQALWARMRGGPPYVATAWGSDLNDEDFPKPEAHARAVDELLRGAAALTADSAPLLERAARRGAAAIPRALVLWGVDLTAFDPARAEPAAAAWRARLELPEGRLVLLSPRQTLPHYHADLIVRAFAASRWAERGALILKLHGRAGEAEERAQLEALAEELGARSRLRFAPPCPYAELPGLYALADAAVSAIDVDGFPSTFCELLALGVPLCAPDLPAYRGLLAAEDNALLVPPADHAALVGALDRLLDEPDLSAGLRARGAAWAREVADWERCVDRFEAAYREAPGRAR